MRSGRSSPIRFAALDGLVRQHAALAAQHGLRSDVRLLPKARLAPCHHVVVHSHSSRKPALRGHHHVFADSAVVPDVHQVVDLRAVVNQRISQCATVYAGVRPNLNIRANLDTANLRKLLVAAVLQHKPKAVGPDHAARMQNRPGSDLDARVNCDIRVDPASVSHDRVVPHIASSFDDRARANPYAVVKHDVRSNRRPFAHSGRLGNRRRRVNSR